MLIKQDCLLLVGVMDPRNSSLTVASLSSAGPCTVETVQHLILPEALRISGIAMQKPFNWQMIHNISYSVLNLNNNHFYRWREQPRMSSCNNNSIKRSVITNYFDYPLLVQVSFKANMSNICWFQLLKREDLLLLFVIYDSKWKVFRFWTVGWTKEAKWRLQFGLTLHFID